MSVAATIQRSGTPILWRKMLGTGGVYDYATATVVVPPPAAPVTIYAIIDGYGTATSKVINAEEFDESNRLEFGGTYHVFTAETLSIGDVVEFGGDTYTVFEVKQVWKKANIVMCQSLVRR